MWYVKVSDSLWISKTHFNVYERHVISSKWATAYKCSRLSSKWMNVLCSGKSERQPMSATGSVQSGWTECVKFKVSDSLWVPQAQSKVYKHHVLSSKWATAYECHRLSPKGINVMCYVQSEQQPKSLTDSVQIVWTSCVQFKVSDSLQVLQAQFKMDELCVFSSKWRQPMSATGSF